MLTLWMGRRMHVSWFIAAGAVSVVVGVALAPSVGMWFGALSWLLTGCALVLLACLRQRVYVLLFVIAGGLLIGLWRGSIGQSEQAIYQSIVGQNVVVSGAVSEDPDIGKKGETVLRISSVAVNDQPVGGTIWLNTASKAGIKRADRVQFAGKLQAGFGSFGASMYRATLTKLERPEPGDVAGRVRDWFADKVRQGIPEPEASLGIGYLVGQRRALPPELSEALRIAGLTHVVVASGYNLTILVRLARRLFVRVSKYLSVFAAGGMVVSFMAVTGNSPSMARAGLVAGLSLLAWYYGRKFHPLVLLPFAAAVTVLVNPSYIWGDLGWQLSFGAFAGVMILAPLAQRYFFGDKKPGTIRQILGETIAAQIVTMPILIMAFGQFSNVAVFANLLVLPLVPLAMLLVFAGGMITVAIPVIAPIVLAPATWLLTYMTATAQFFAGQPWALSDIQFGPLAVVGCYVVLAGICWYMWRKTKYNLRDANIVE